MSLKSIATYLICIGASLMVGFWGSQSTIPSILGWYSTIVHPSWTPPNWVFAPVWTILYVLMGTAAALVWRSGKKHARLPVAFFFAHLLVNYYWTAAFFGAHDPKTALLVIAALWVMVLVMIIWFWRYAQAASILLVPYLVWVTYAASLNAGVVFLNP